MKKIKNSFLFFWLLTACVFHTSSTGIYAQQAIDSIDYYYKLSKDNSKTNAQQRLYIDKVISFAEKTDDNESQLKGLNRKSYLYSKFKMYDSAIITAKLLLNKSIEVKDSSMLLKTYKKLADYNRLNDSLLSAYEFYEEYKNLSLSLKDSLGIIKGLRFISSIQNKFGFPYESEASAVEALKLLDILKNDETTIEAKIGIYNHLGIVYRELKNYDRAIELYDKVLKIAQTQKQINIVRNNKANVYREQHKFKLAINELNTVYENSLIINDKKQIARALDNLGLAQSKLNYPDALSAMMEALQIRIKENDPSGIYTSYIHLIEYFKDRNDKDKVTLYANKAYDIALNLNNIAYKVEALSHIVDLDDDIKIIEYKKLVDSIAEVKQLNNNKFASIKYDYAKQERKAIKSQLSQEKERRLKIMYQAIGVLILLTFIFTYFILKFRHRQDKLQKIYETETRLAKKLHDEVANDVYNIMSGLQKKPKANSEVINKLDAIYVKVRDISKEYNDIDFDEGFDATLNDLLLNYRNDQVNIITQGISKMDWNNVTRAKRIAIYRALQELLVNMKKYSKATHVLVSFKNAKNKLVIHYSDNGVGYDLRNNGKPQNTENRIKTINGTIIFESEKGKGFKAKITV